jgi:hypothetical protein
MDWSAFRASLYRWMKEQVVAGVGDYKDVERAILAILRNDEEHTKSVAPRLRAAVEDDYFGSVMPTLPREQRVEVLAALWTQAAEHDKRSQQLRGAITKLEKTQIEYPYALKNGDDFEVVKRHRPLSRDEVWRVLQAAADSYRDGEPLGMKDRVTLLARKYLGRELMADANDMNGSKAHDRLNAIDSMVTRAEDEKVDPLPNDVRPVDEYDRFPLLGDILEMPGAKGEYSLGDGPPIVPKFELVVTAIGPARPVDDGDQPVDDPRQSSDK